MIVFRVDSSIEIGSGHLMRCLTLAGQLKSKNQDGVAFITRNLQGNLNYLIEQQGYRLYTLPKGVEYDDLDGYEKWLTVKLNIDAEQTKEILQKKKADYLIVDSYAIDSSWERVVRPYVKNIVVIDDLANRKHDCDFLLDQNYYFNMDSRYNGLVPSECKLFLGPKYILFREEFYKAIKKARIRNGNIANILVFFGGSDLTNETMKALRAIIKIKDIRITVVVGGSNPNKEEIARFCLHYHNIRCFFQVNNMAELMNQADLAIGAGGMTTWERCFLGLPALVFAIAENQIVGSSTYGKMGITYYGGQASDITESEIYTLVQKIMGDKVRYQAMIANMKQLFINNEKRFSDVLLEVEHAKV